MGLHQLAIGHILGERKMRCLPSGGCVPAKGILMLNVAVKYTLAGETVKDSLRRGVVDKGILLSNAFGKYIVAREAENGE